MIRKEVKYNLHYDDVLGHFLRLPHGNKSNRTAFCFSLFHMNEASQNINPCPAESG